MTEISEPPANTEAPPRDSGNAPTQAATSLADAPDGSISAGQASLRRQSKKVIFTRVLFRRATFVWAGIVAVLSLSPVTPSLLHQTSDKIEHFAAYTLLCFLAMCGWTRARILFFAVLAILTFGATMEGLQWFVPGRSSEWRDMAANTLGVLAGLVAASIWSALHFRSTDQPSED